MMEQKWKEYARLLVEVGVNIQKGQTLVLFCPVDHAPFARLCADAAYDLGAREVVNVWTDNYMVRAKYLRAEDSVFSEFPQWRADMFYALAKQGAAFLHLRANDPENLLGVDPERILRANKAAGEAQKPYRALSARNVYPWTIGCLSSPKWAKKVFPDLEESAAVQALWDRIFEAVRVKGDGTAVEAWKQHTENLRRRMKILNDYNFKSLHYKSANGTDFTVMLAVNHVWEAGGDVTASGQPYMPNMPTEEIFTAPNRTGSNGVICAVMPLCRDGNVIRDIRFTVRDGKIVEAHASSGEEVLKNAISVDEGASYFGEVALVPYDSPIRRSGVLYYETLYDENASCHFAFGHAYASTLKGGTQMTKEEQKAAGLNDSITHVDFMVGAKDLSITGTTFDGREIPVFIDGNFAF